MPFLNEAIHTGMTPQGSCHIIHSPCYSAGLAQMVTCLPGSIGSGIVTRRDLKFLFENFKTRG